VVLLLDEEGRVVDVVGGRDGGDGAVEGAGEQGGARLIGHDDGRVGRELRDDLPVLRVQLKPAFELRVADDLSGQHVVDQDV
jgi:hypothetical protein